MHYNEMELLQSTLLGRIQKLLERMEVIRYFGESRSMGREAETMAGIWIENYSQIQIEVSFSGKISDNGSTSVYIR